MADCIAPTYLPAAYNGIYFQAIVAGSEHGRRGVTGEFPFGEKTKYQDLGIKARKFSISGRFQGPDCVTQTTSLINAVETPGTGTLIHPTRGVLNVACSSIKIKDDILQGAGETTFDMDFIDAGTNSSGMSGFPVIPSISDIITAVTNSFSDNYNPGVLAFFQNSIVSNTAYSALSAIATAFANAIPSQSSDLVYQTLYQSQSYASNLSTWSSSASMINALTFGSAAIDTYCSDPLTEYNTFLSLANQFALSSNYSGNVADCEEAIYTTVRTLCAAYMMRAATQIVATTLDQSLGYLDTITNIILEEKQNAINFEDDDLYIALTEFQATAIQTMLNYSYNLPPVISYNFKGGVPSLVAAHEIYGDCTQFQSLELRNPNAFPYALGPTIYALSVQK